MIAYSQKQTLAVSGLSKRHGAGCPSCLGGGALTKNYCPECGAVHALRDVSFELYEGEALGIVGESGSGKSTLMQCLYFDQEPTAGQAFLADFEGGASDIFSVSGQKRRYVRDRLLGMVYQNPTMGLKMRFSALSNIAEKLLAAGSRNVGYMDARARELLAHVKLPEERIKDRPSTFSGGMQQRVQIAKALSNNPPILLLDEVTTGLDLSVQAKVLDLIKAVQRDFSVSMLLVSHDLAVVRMLADRTMVMLDGRVVEAGLTDQIMEDPQHPYTQELVQSLL